MSTCLLVSAQETSCLQCDLPWSGSIEFYGAGGHSMFKDGPLSHGLLQTWCLGRQPCSLMSEMFLAIGSIALLALARHLTSDIEAQNFPPQHYFMQTSLECAEFLPDCSVELVKDSPHSATCVEGVTFGCMGNAHHSGRPGVWVAMGCRGIFHLKKQEGEHYGGMRRLDATFALAPRGGGAEEFHGWLKASKHPWAERVRIFDSADEVEALLRSKGYPARDEDARSSEALCGAVVFDTKPWTSEVKYTLRFNQSLGYDPNLPAIAAVFKSTKLTTAGLVEPKKDGQPNTFDGSGLIWSAFLLISLAYSVNRMITGVVMEREARLREGMRMMGMRSSAFYASWVATYVLLYLFVVTGVVLLLTVGEILPRSSPSLLFIWLMTFSLAAIAYGLVITTFFTRAKTAATVGSILFYTTSYLKHLANPGSSSSTLRLLSLLPPVAFELGADLVAGLESLQVGVTWSNVGLRFHNYSLLESGGMLFLDTILLLVLFFYLDQVMPREVGLQRPWYFPLIFDMFHGKPKAPEASALVERDVGAAAAMMSRNGQTVEISKLSKRFGQLHAVQNLDLVMYQGEIFALLGHNGAGKTTTLAMLCGLIPPSSGRCVVFGSDHPEEAQRCLGVCPQHDVLWETMTCEEHLRLFAGFKGVPAEAVLQEVAFMLERVGLEKAGASKTQAGRLSGGMKRKLSLGIAFLGGSQLVVLDEPTSGLDRRAVFGADPFSRRAVWELLRSMKQQLVIVLSTHYMDEADILGDRRLRLARSFGLNVDNEWMLCRLKCCGSPQFLKRAYDCGYNVTFVKRSGCDIDVVREAVSLDHVARMIATSVGQELILQFPFTAARHFPKVLGSLEQQLEELRVESYGISVTTLEEVFLKVASGDVVPRSKRAPSSPTSPQTNMEYIELGEVGETEPQVPHGAARERLKYGLRDRRGVLCQLLMPTATLVLFLVLLSKKLFSSQPILELAVTDYNKHCHAAGPGAAEWSNQEQVSAAFVALFRGEELFLVRGRQSGLWQLPGGMIEASDLNATCEVPFAVNGETREALWRPWRNLEDLDFRWPNDQTIPQIFDMAQAEDGRRPVVRAGCYMEMRPTLRCGGHMRESAPEK
eukprot:g4217.t1